MRNIALVGPALKPCYNEVAVRRLRADLPKDERERLETARSQVQLGGAVSVAWRERRRRKVR